MNWAVLLAVLVQVESGGDTNAVGDGGKAIGCLQMHAIMVKDASRISGIWFRDLDRTNQETSEFMAKICLEHYGRSYTKRTGEEPTMEIYARIWNGGYHGLFRNYSATDSYWAKCQKVLAQMEEK